MRRALLAVLVVCLSECYVNALSLDALRYQALTAVNEIRSGAGLNPLRLSNEFNKASQDWAQHLADTNTFTSSPGDYFETMYRQSKPYTNANQFMQAWVTDTYMDIFNTSWLTRLGLGVGKSTNGDYTVVIIMQK